MNTIAVSELRSNLMNILKEIKHGSIIHITARGKVIAKLVPPDYTKESAKRKLKEISDTAIIKDIVSPIDIKWESAQ